MAEIVQVKAVCDNCGTKEDKCGFGQNKLATPVGWGSAILEEGAKDGLFDPNPGKINCPDLCPHCTAAVFEAAQQALAKAKGDVG